MDDNHLNPFSATGLRVKQIDDAKEMQNVIAERANRTGDRIPPYEFLELIGKGAFGRVYKCKSKETRNIVAVKIIDVDAEDFKQDHKLRDETIEGFIKEVNTLKQVRDSQAKNINHIQEAFDLHSQLWIVSDYCSGGSVHTLMKASEPKPHLEERFIIPIARELAIALSHVHEAGVIHRDIKCGNVLISEDGQLQLCDFGVAAVIESNVSKRSTIIGTPYWMAPEMHDDTAGYGTEIDCWAFGCTVFEMATGMPPYHTFAPAFLRQVLKSVPRLKDGDYSKELCDFVAFCLHANPHDRPSAKQILAHPYIANTSDRYPTQSLSELIDRYILWERKGGQRMSLFNAHGAAAPQMPGEQQDMADSWIFSTTVQFEKDYERRHSRAPSITAMDFRSDAFNDDDDNDNENDNDDQPSPTHFTRPPRTSSKAARVLTPYEQAKEEASSKRGEKSIQRLFQLDNEPYDYDTAVTEESPRRLSDLPLRNRYSDRAANRETLIDLDTGAMDMTGPPSFTFEIGDVPTMKANRQSQVEGDGDVTDDISYRHFTQHTRRPTRDWKFPSFDLPPDDENTETKRATRDWKFPTSRSGETVAETVHTANRRTMDWTFNTAEHIEEQEPEPDFAFPSLHDKGPPTAGFRPHLQRTATEPVGHFNDFIHPPQTSLDMEHRSAASRDSTAVIDPDEVYQPNFVLEPAAEITRSTTPLSISNSISSVGPFGFDQASSRPGSSHKHNDSDLAPTRYSHRRQQKSSVSHIVAQQRISRSLHDRRQNSQGSQGSNGLNGGSFGGSSRIRTNSVDSTASSTADEQSSWEHNGRDYNKYIGAKMRDQLRIGLQRTVSQPGRPPQRLTSDSYDDIESEPYATGPYGTSSTQHNGGPTATASNAPSMTLLGNGSMSTGFETDTTSSSFQDLSSRVPRTAIAPAGRGQVNLVFPEINAPDRAALSESANKELMYAEVDKLFGAAEDALGYAVDMFRRRELEFAEDLATGSGGGTSTGPTGGNLEVYYGSDHRHTESGSEFSKGFGTTSEEDESAVEAL